MSIKYRNANVGVTLGGGGGGGGRTVYESYSDPTANDGAVGDFCMKRLKLSTDNANRLYTINLTPARVGSGGFTYFGISGIDAVFEDGNGNQILLSSVSDKNAMVKTTNATSYIGSISTGYCETSGTPYRVTFSGTIPAGYAFKTLKVAQRNSTSWRDYWSAFTVDETVNGVTIPSIISQPSLSYDDWAGPGNWTVFNAVLGGYLDMFAKVDSSTWVSVENLTTAQIDSLGLTTL